MGKARFQPIAADKAVNLYEALISVRRLQLHPALGRTVSEVGVAAIDAELAELVPKPSLNHVASQGLRGERVFPVPSVVRHAPPLIGYYRMLLGLSKKEFTKLGYGSWKGAEEKGIIAARLDSETPAFCRGLIGPLVQLVDAMQTFDDRDLGDLALLTFGPTLQGGRNNMIGKTASKKVFEALKVLVEDRITSIDSDRRVRFEASGGREFILIEGSDPDVRLDALEGGEEVPVVAMEIKGGEDASNAHNRAGEAEKSHIKAKAVGYDHRWTIMVMQSVARARLQTETPSSTEIFEASEVMKRSGNDWNRLRQKLAEVTSKRSP